MLVYRNITYCKIHLETESLLASGSTARLLSVIHRRQISGAGKFEKSQAKAESKVGEEKSKKCGKTVNLAPRFCQTQIQCRPLFHLFEFVLPGISLAEQSDKPLRELKRDIKVEFNVNK